MAGGGAHGTAAGLGRVARGLAARGGRGRLAPQRRTEAARRHRARRRQGNHIQGVRDSTLYSMFRNNSIWNIFHLR